MPLSANPVIIPEGLPDLPFTVKCLRGAERSGLVRGKLYDVIFVCHNVDTKRGKNAKGYVVMASDNSEVLPIVWRPDRFSIVEDSE